MTEFLSAYALPAFAAVLTALAGWLSAQLKRLADKWLADRTRRAVARTCVRAVEQLYHDLDGDAKLQKAEEAVVAMLRERGLEITELELRMDIEAVVAEFNWCFGGGGAE
jgi:hypothetical protein